MVDVSAAAGIPVETLRKIETGRIVTPAFFTVAALAHALELDLSALAHTQENISLTAQRLGVSRVTLYRMLHRHAIVLNRGLKSAPGAGQQAL